MMRHYVGDPETDACITRISDTMSPERRGYIEAALAVSADFSDGAFHAYMEEQGIDIYEIVAVCGDKGELYDDAEAANHRRKQKRGKKRG